MESTYVRVKKTLHTHILVQRYEESKILENNDTQSFI